MPDRSRIPPKPVDFATYIINTDNRQLSIDQSTGKPRWMLWNWTLADSKQWSQFRQRCYSLYTLYATKALKNKKVKDEMFDLIKETRRYDNGRGVGHHLLNLVAIHGNIEDWRTFRVKQGTALQKKHTRSKGNPGRERPVIIIRKYTAGGHRLSVRNAARDLSRAKPEGIAFVQVYRYIGTTPPKSLMDYEQIGVAKRGIFVSRFDHLKFDRDKKYFAWYFARYKHRLGKLGMPGNIVWAMVLS